MKAYKGRLTSVNLASNRSR